MQLDYVFVVDLFHDFNFGLNVFQVVGVEEELFIDYFNGYFLGGSNYFAFINYGVRA